MYKVLIVEDSFEMKELLINVLSQYEVDTVSADDGFDAIRKIKEHKFDLILTDVNMPNMSGID